MNKNSITAWAEWPSKRMFFNDLFVGKANIAPARRNVCIGWLRVTPGLVTPAVSPTGHPIKAGRTIFLASHEHTKAGNAPTKPNTRIKGP